MGSSKEVSGLSVGSNDSGYVFPACRRGMDIPVHLDAFGIDTILHSPVLPFVVDGRIGFRCQMEDAVYRVYSNQACSVLQRIQACEMASVGAVKIRCGSSDDTNSANDLLAVVTGVADDEEFDRVMEDFGIDDEDDLYYLVESSKSFFPSSMEAITIMGKLSDGEAKELAESLRQAADKGLYRDYGKRLTEYVSDLLEGTNSETTSSSQPVVASSRRSLFRSLQDLVRG